MQSRQITSPQHPLIKHLVKLRKNRDYRYEHNTLIIEGIKLLEELPATASISTVVATREDLLPSNLQAKELILVPPSLIEKIAAQKNPEGILAEVAIPHCPEPPKIKKIVILDHVSDPGNLGALLRTALALGWDALFLIDGSCDPYNPKALAAGRGATFKLPLLHGSWQDANNLISKHQLKPLLADLQGENITKINVPAQVALILGNEAHGASSEARKISQKITIPISSSMESLNVAIAGAILMYEIGKG